MITPPAACDRRGDGAGFRADRRGIDDPNLQGQDGIFKW